MGSPRRTYVVSLYDGDKSVVVEAVQRDERARLDDLDRLPERIRQWEVEEASSPRDERHHNRSGTRPSRARP